MREKYGKFTILAAIVMASSLHFGLTGCALKNGGPAGSLVRAVDGAEEAAARSYAQQLTVAMSTNAAMTGQTPTRFTDWVTPLPLGQNQNPAISVSTYDLGGGSSSRPHCQVAETVIDCSGGVFRSIDVIYRNNAGTVQVEITPRNRS
ncbi:MAG: hypothetical protein K2X01_04185 [Cyanobacteria bacterium]|nr:hypothetical protein [Cyanobacteriota bacterium]